MGGYFSVLNENFFFSKNRLKKILYKKPNVDFKILGSVAWGNTTSSVFQTPNVGTGESAAIDLNLFTRERIEWRDDANK